MVVIGVYKYRNVGTLCYQIAFMASQEIIYDLKFKKVCKYMLWWGDDSKLFFL